MCQQKTRWHLKTTEEYLQSPVYVQDTVAEGLEDGMEKLEGGLLLQELEHQVGADEGVPLVLLHTRQPVGQRSRLRHSDQHCHGNIEKTQSSQRYFTM